MSGHMIGASGCNPGLHCFSCNRDEPADKAVVVCYECGHVYPTAWALKRAYLRASLRAFQREMQHPIGFTLTPAASVIGDPEAPAVWVPVRFPRLRSARSLRISREFYTLARPRPDASTDTGPCPGVLAATLATIATAGPDIPATVLRELAAEVLAGRHNHPNHTTTRREAPTS